MELPANISTGRVTGQFIVGIADGADLDDEPDFIAAQGTVTFTASTPYLPNPTASPNPVTMLNTSIVAILDGEGYLCTPDPNFPGQSGRRGIRLVATDDKDASVEGWTWKATPRFQDVNGTPLGAIISTFDFALPSGSTVDLTTVVKVPASQGIGTEQAEALAASAQAAAVRAAADAAAVKDKALANDAGVAGFLKAGTQTSTALSAAIDAKVAPQAEALAGKADLVGGKVSPSQLPTITPVTDSTIAPLINGATTGAAIDARINTQVTPQVQKITTDFIAGDRAVADAAAAAVNAAPKIVQLETVTIPKTLSDAKAYADTRKALAISPLPTGTDIDSVRERGTYLIDSTNTANTMLNLPFKGPGLLTVDATPAGVVKQEIMIYGTAGGGRWARQTNRINTAPYPFSPWDRMTWGQGEVPINQDLNTYTVPGWSTFSYKGLADTLKNFPPAAVRAAGHVEVLSHPSGGNYQRVIVIGAGGGIWQRRTLNVTTQTWTDWESVGGAPATPAPAASYPNAGLANAVRLQAFRRRRNGVLGTAGKPAIALRFDHGLIKFRDIVLPLLREFGLPSGLALNSRGWDRPESLGITAADVSKWVLNDGVEIWNHGATHGAASTTEGYVDEIVNGKKELETQFPMSAIEQWCVPGVGEAGYGGQSATDKPESFFDYEAGRIIMEHHAVSTGHIPNMYRELYGEIQQGLSHQGMDSTGLSVIMSRMRTAASLSRGIQLMMHPSVIDEPGMITAAELRQVLAYIAAERDAGRLVVLSMSGLLMADTSHSRRPNLILDSDFTGSITSGVWFQSGWTKGAAGWAKSNGSTTPIYQSLITMDQSRGALHEFAVKVKAAAAGVVEVRVHNSTDPNILNATKTVNLAAGEERTVRVFATLPLVAANHSHRVQVTDTSGAGIEVSAPSLRAV